MPDHENTGAAAHPSSDAQGWREVAEKASKEKDPHTLLKLVQELCDKIDEGRGNQVRGARTVVAAVDNRKPIA